MIERLVTAFVLAMYRRPRLTLAGVVLLTLASGALAAARVRPDFSVDSIVPVWDPARVTYERYKLQFPHADGRAIVIVEAPDVFTPEGVSRVADLEKDLAKIGDGDVIDTESLASAREVVAVGADDLRSVYLFPAGPASDEEIARRRTLVTTDPLYRWRLAPPDGRATTIRVALRSEADQRATTGERFQSRMRFLREARAVLARHERPGQTLTLGGVPATRAQYAEMIGKDMSRLFPAALAIVVALLWITLGSVRDVSGALVAIAASITWTMGAHAIAPIWDGQTLRFGAPLQILTQIAPMVVMIISISDSAHVIARWHERRAEGEGTEAALEGALRDAAVPCFLTEVVIAGGFLSLAAVNIVAILELGVVLAMGMMLTWLANMTVLPLVLRAGNPRSLGSSGSPVHVHVHGTAETAETAGTAGTAGNTLAARLIERFIAWVTHAVTARPGRVAAGALIVIALGAHAASRVQTGSYVYDDLRPENPLARRLAKSTELYGGTVPLAVFIEAADGGTGETPALEPEALALADRCSAALRRAAPEAKLVLSPGDVARKVHRLWVGDAEAAEPSAGGVGEGFPLPGRESPLPSTRALAAQELQVIDERILRDVVSFDRRASAVFAVLPDLGSARASEIARALEDALAPERAAHPRYRISLTGIFAVSAGVHRTLTGGLLSSFALAALVSLAVFTLALRSWRLGLLALVPNLLPLALTIGFMGLAGIAIKPSTVIAFSITLTIADDDTIQFLAHFRRLFAAAVHLGVPDPHDHAVRACLREAGLPMLVTAGAVSMGFASLGLSEFLGLAHLGILIGVSLFAAVFADLFLTPLLILWTRPRFRVADHFKSERSHT